MLFRSVPMDGFHLSNKELERLGRSNRKGAPDTFDVAGYQALLRRLKQPIAGEVIYAPAFYRNIEEPIAGSIPVFDHTPLVISEGNYLLLDHGGWEATRDLFDECWFVMALPKERRGRLVERHMYFGRTPIEAETWVDQTRIAINATSNSPFSKIFRFTFKLGGNPVFSTVIFISVIFQCGAERIFKIPKISRRNRMTTRANFGLPSFSAHG